MLLECATADPSLALARWSEYLVQHPIDTVSWEEYRLLPAVWKNLVRAGKPFPENGRLRGIYRHTFAQNSRLLEDCKQSVSRLQESGIRVMVLKGVPLLTDIYPDVGRRPTQDYDLLVSPAQIDEAMQLLLSEGWTIESSPFYPPALRLEHAVGLGRQGRNLDLHWFSLRECRNPREDRELWAQAVPLTLDGVETLTASPQLLLCHLLVLASREPRNTFRYLVDIHFLKVRHEAEIKTEQVVEFLQKRQLLHRIKYLPNLKQVWPELLDVPGATVFDKIWSWSSRCVLEGRHEWMTGVYPFADFFRHHLLIPESKLSFCKYMRLRLEIKGWRDLLNRTLKKFRRTLTS